MKTKYFSVHRAMRFYKIGLHTSFLYYIKDIPLNELLCLVHSLAEYESNPISFIRNLELQGPIYD